MGKAETIKKRAVYVYLPSTEHKERWERYARAQGTSISKFVIENVENSLNQAEDQSYKSLGDLRREVKQLKEELDKETREKHVLEIAMERLEEELKKYRAQPFLDEDFFGVRRYQRELVEILRKGRIVSSDEILSRLRISSSELEVVKAVSRQLENLESYGIVKSSPKGWKWVRQ